jgi:hypothetical protein
LLHVDFLYQAFNEERVARFGVATGSSSVAS